MDFFRDRAVLFALMEGVAVVYGIGLTVWLMNQPTGNERMREIAAPYRTAPRRILEKAVPDDCDRRRRPVAADRVLRRKLGWGTAIGFVIGAVLSGVAGFIGMNVAVRSNVRTVEAARHGPAGVVNVAFRAGSVTGLLVVGLGLGVAGYGVLTEVPDNSPDSAINDLIGSLVAR